MCPGHIVVFCLMCVADVFRWCSSVSTRSARPLNSDPPFTTLFRYALIMEWISPMPRLLSCVIKVYASVEAQALALLPVTSPHQPSTLWLVARSVRLHMALRAQHAALATFLFTHMICRCHHRWLFLHRQTVSIEMKLLC